MIKQPKLIIALILVGIGLFFLSAPNRNSTPQPVSEPSVSKQTEDNIVSSSAKGVIQIRAPQTGQEIRSPLMVTGLVYGNNGTLTIKLKQKNSGMYVTEDKVVTLFGKSDTINFAEAIQFGLPVEPQLGILEIIYKDKSGKGLDDKVSVEVNFPGDLGSGK